MKPAANPYPGEPVLRPWWPQAVRASRPQLQEGEVVYEKPKVVCFGSLRELTLWGSGGAAGDTGAVFGMAYQDECGVRNGLGCDGRS